MSDAPISKEKETPPQWALDAFNYAKERDPSIYSLEKSRFGDGWDFIYATRNGDLHSGSVKNNPPRLEKCMVLRLPPVPRRSQRLREKREREQQALLGKRKASELESGLPHE